MFKTLFAIVAVAALTALPALLHGKFSNRWGEPANLSLAGGRLHEFPRQVGDWRSDTDERPLSDEVCAELGLVEHFHRKYTHPETGQRLDVLLMVGPAGRLVRHPPDVCYTNRANQQVGKATALEIPGRSTPHQFQVLHFKRKQVHVGHEFWVAYAYAAEQGKWSTPASPRMAFGAAPVLYKLQVLSTVSEQGNHEELSAFLAQFVEAFPAVLVDDLVATSAEGQLEHDGRTE